MLYFNIVIGNRIGRIQILGLLGQGGMGQVHEGFDEKLERRVAVKRLDDSSRLNEITRARFEQEAKILSRLDHPNICRIFDVLEDEDHAYLVLELIEGTNLRELMGRNIDAQERLRIIEQIAVALAAAHTEGVVHRDLKPDNVMVGNDGVVKVLDFGIAHSIRGDVFHDETLSGNEPLTDPGIKTIYGKAVGTPRFMSPEQARGEPVTPASDLFSLGLLMQELLTGEAPYDAEIPANKLLQEVSEGRSRPIVGLSRPLTELIEGLKSFRPVERMTAAEVVRKLRWIAGSKQRRIKRVIGVFMAVAVIVGVAKYTVDLRRERSLAVEARSDSEQLVTFLLEDLARDLSPLGRLSLLEKVSQEALKYYEGLPEPLSTEASYSRGRAFGLVAEVALDKGQVTPALDAAIHAVDIHQILVEKDPRNTEWRNALAGDYLRLGELLELSGDADGATEALNTCRDLAETLVASDSRNILFLETLGEAHYGLGLNVVFVDPERAIENFSKAILIYQDLNTLRPAELKYRYRLAVLNGQGLGQAYSLCNREAEALEAVTTAHDGYKEIFAEDPTNAHLLFAYAWEKRRLGDLLEGMGRLSDAWSLYDESLAISRQLLSLEPLNSSWQEGLAIDYLSIGNIRQRQGQYEEALEAYEKAEEIYTTLIDIEPGFFMYQMDLAETLDGQGLILRDLGEIRAAEIVWRRALQLMQQSPNDPDDPDPFPMSLRATLLIRLGRVAEAEPLVEQLVARGAAQDPGGGDLVELLESAR